LPGSRRMKCLSAPVPCSMFPAAEHRIKDEIRLYDFLFL
jgi:hypothetical protein